MARPKHDPDAEPTSDRILAAAGPAFAVAGYADVRLADVARTVGIRRPSLLYHFGSKDQLYAAVIQRTFNRLREALLGAMSLEDGFAERIDALVRGYLAFLDGSPEFAPLVLRELLDGRGPGRDLILAELVPLLDRLDGFLEEGAGEAPGAGSWRQTILLLASSPLVRAASGPLRGPLWGPGEDLPRLARLLILGA